MTALSRAAIFLLLAIPAVAQVRGTPASVTSPRPGGTFNGAVQASVTSLGPHGFQGSTPFIGGFESRFRGHHFRGQRHFTTPFFYPVYVAVPVIPVYVPVEAQVEEEDESALPAPTIFERRPRRVSYPRPEPPVEREPEPRAAAPEPLAPAAPTSPAAPVEDREPIILVFRDGKRLEVLNYAILGDTLINLTANATRRKVLLDDLDLPATIALNDERGLTFRLPKRS